MLGNELQALPLDAFRVADARADDGSLIPEAKAQALSAGKKLGLIAVVADNALLNDTTQYTIGGSSATLRERIFALAQNMQDRVPHSQAIVMGVDATESTAKISRVLEKLYFEGADSSQLDGNSFNDGAVALDDNQLIGAEFIGNVPMPVVFEADKSSSVSLYPYVDFYNKAYIYNYKTNHFEANGEAGSPTPEIWHGVISPTSKDPANSTAQRQQIADYLYKNSQYSLPTPNLYNTFDQRVLVSNFPAMESKLNVLDYRNYLHFMTYLEEIAYKRFNKHLLKSLVDTVTGEQNPGVPLSQATPIMDQAAIDAVNDINIPLIFMKYTSDWKNALTTYMGKLNNLIGTTGRWSKTELDSTESLVAARDSFTKVDLLSKNLQLEKQTNGAIESDVVNLQVRLNVCPLGGPCYNPVATGGFTFTGINTNPPSAQICYNPDPKGILIGGGPSPLMGLPINPDPLADNSVRVEALRMFDPKSTAFQTAGESDALCDSREDYTKIWPDCFAPYKAYGGCVANNNTYPTTISNGDTYLAPTNCQIDKASSSVFDLAGSREIPGGGLGGPGFPVPGSPKGFLPEPDVYDGDGNLVTPGAREALVPCAPTSTSFAPADASVYNQPAVNGNLVTLTLGDVIDRVTGNQLRETSLAWLIPILKFTPPGSPSGFGFSPSAGYWLDVTAVPVYTRGEPVSTIKHIQPTEDTLAKIRAAGGTPSVPMDGRHFIEFGPVATNRDGTYPQITLNTQNAEKVNVIEFRSKQTYVYPDLFKIAGDNAAQVTTNLAGTIALKDSELNGLTGKALNLMQALATANPALFTDTLVWRNLGIDQKYQIVQQKYMDQNNTGDSTLATPEGMQVMGPPNVKTQGYEVWHLFAEGGDETGYNFGINAKMLEQLGAPDPDIDALPKCGNKKTEQGETCDDGNTSSGDGCSGTCQLESAAADNSGNYVCGDPKGVEIWDWFAAVQCWINNEIKPAEKLFALDNTCTGAPTTDPSQPPIPDLTLDPVGTVPVPASLTVSMAEETLMSGKSTTITVMPLDSAGQQVFGYQATPITFALSDASVGSFSPESVFSFEGKVDTIFTAGQTGEATLTVSMGNITSAPITVRVVPEIKVNLVATENTVQGGPQSYSIAATLTDDQGGLITNNATTVQLATGKALDGTFANNGVIGLTAGTGSVDFFPNPCAGGSVTLTANHPSYATAPYTIPLSPPPATQIIVDAPAFFPVGAATPVTVKAADGCGNPVLTFDRPLTATITAATQPFGTVGAGTATAPIPMTAGLGILTVTTGKLTGPLNVIVSDESLPPASIQKKVLARVDSATWGQTFPQNLFASLIGFPAGDFMKDNYFGGTHLFAGKTEAVFSTLNAPAPPALVTLTPTGGIHLNANQQATVVAAGTSLSVQVYNPQTLRSQLTETVPLNFSAVSVIDPAAVPPVPMAPGNLYVEMSDPSASAMPTATGGLTLNDAAGQPVMTVEANAIKFSNYAYRLFFETDPEADLLELSVSDGTTELARLLLNFSPQSLKSENYIIDSALQLRTTYGGSSTNDPTGLELFDPAAAPATAQTLDENFGFEGENKYITLFGGGMPIGEAVKYNMPKNGVLLGDPTVTLVNKSNTSLNFDSTVGEKFFQDPAGSGIAALTKFNFNNDGYPDVAAVMQDGRVRLFEGGPVTGNYRDRGDIAFMSDGAIAIEAFDFKNDGYEDLVVATNDGRLAVLNNDATVITRTDQTLKVGKKLYKLLKADMDQDGNPDLVTLDSLGDIRIFYTTPANEGGIPSPASLPQNGSLIANYGIFVNTSANLNYDLKVRYAGIPEPNPAGGAQAPLPPLVTAPTADQLAGLTPPPTPDPNLLSALTDFLTKDTSQSLSEAAENAQLAAVTAAADQGRDNQAAATENDVPKLPWAEGTNTETYFAPLTDASANFLTVNKTVSNKDRPGATTADIGETLNYTITVTSSRNQAGVVLADTVPDMLTVDTAKAVCSSPGCSGMATAQNDIILFFSGLNLTAGQTLTITYDAVVKFTPQATVFLQNITDPGFSDNYPDIIVSPPYNDTGELIQHYSTGPRAYSVRSVSSAKPAAVTAPVDAGLTQIDCLKNAMTAFSQQSFGENNPPSATFLDDMLAQCNIPATTSGAITPSENPVCSMDSLSDPTNGAQCASDTLDDLGSAISKFSCSGAGCFPVPFNKAFLVPPFSAVPIFAFPTTLPTPLGPMPFVWPGSYLGASTVPGVYNSLLRLYLSPTLTGGIGIALCWGPFLPMGMGPVPPPIFPIPYPPPIGNCMVTALPKSALPYAAACDEIQNAITTAIEAANSVVSDINSGVAAVNGNEGIPAQIKQADESTRGAAGGLEVSLAINLGTKQRFTPPTKGFSNIHIPSFDSILGVISSWVDRETIEITNKLFTLPTFHIRLPDMRTLFSKNFDRTKVLWQAFLNGFNTKLTTRPTATTPTDPLSTLWNDPTLSVTDKALALAGNVGSKAANALTTAGNGLDTVGAVGSKFSNQLEQLYTVANSIPFLNINEQRVEFKIPWLSPTEINDFINDLQQWVVHMKREIARVKDAWSRLTCSATSDPNDNNWIINARGNCIGSKIAAIFLVNINPLIDSVTQNIAVLKSYLAFPQKFIAFKAQLANYIRDVGCFINVYANLLGGWFATLKQQISAYAEVYLTIVEIIKNWKKMVDIFINFSDNCDICTNERYASFGWFTLLGLVIPDIPIIQFPKWPDVVFDISDIKGQITLDIPMIHFVPEQIKLPRLPYINLPDIPTFSLLFTIPPLPILPSLPDLPTLPPLPAIPTLKLPTLPPPPKLPDIAAQFSAIIPIIQKVLNIWCMIKKALTPVPEGFLNDQISILTNRPAYLIPLDLLKPKLANITAFDLGFNEIRIAMKVFLGIHFSVVSTTLQNWATTWNLGVTDFMQYIKDLPFNQAALTAYMAKAQASINEVDSYVKTNINEAQQTSQQWLDENATNLKWDDLGKAFANAQDSLQNFSRVMQQKVNAGGDWVNREITPEIMNAFKNWVLLPGYYTAFGVEAGVQLMVAFTGGSTGRLAKYIVTVNGELTTQDIQNVFQGMADGINRGAAFTVVVTADGLQVLSTPFAWSAEGLQEFSQGAWKLTGQPLDIPGILNAGMDTFFDGYKQYFQPYINGSKISGYVEPSRKLAKSKVVTAEQAKMVGLLKEMGDTISQGNADTVDYRVVKEKLGVPDYHLPSRPTSVDKIAWMQDRLMAYSEQLVKEAHSANGSLDMIALAKEPPASMFPYQMASAESTKGNTTSTLFSSAIGLNGGTQDTGLRTQSLEGLKTELEAKAKTAVAQASPTPAAGGPCTGSCLIDPLTRQLVQFISSFDDPKTTQTVFVPTAVPNQSDVVYSNNTSAYLKRDLAVPADTGNTASGVPNVIFTPDDFAPKDNNGNPLPVYEAVNMFRTTLTGNGSSGFGWKESTNPAVYGYGVEVRQSIEGFDAANAQDSAPDIKIVLLPADSAGKAPAALVNGQPIDYGTLVTPVPEAAMADAAFGMQYNNLITGATQVTFPTVSNATITLRPNQALFYDTLNGSSYNLNIRNGYYHMKMLWFDAQAISSTQSESELIAPQAYGNPAPPIDILFNGTFSVPVYEPLTIKASQIFTDLGSDYQYSWDTNGDALPDFTGPSLNLPPQEIPKQFNVTVSASQNLADPIDPMYQKTFPVTVYVPKITLDGNALKQSQLVSGKMEPKNSDNLSGIPYSLFRQRAGVWKNLGLLKRQEGTPTNPALSDEGTWKDNYYVPNINGSYSISGFSAGPPSAITVTDSAGTLIARILPFTGQIQLLDSLHHLEVIPASSTLPTRVAIVENISNQIVSNVVYAADGNTDVTIVPGELTAQNVGSSGVGVTVGDANPSDDLIAAQIPGTAPSFPGGAIIFNKTPPQIPIAMINTDGDIRLMLPAYKLKLKNEGALTEKPIFTITTQGGTPIMDVFIAANFNNLVLDQNTTWGVLGATIGMLLKTPLRLFAGLEASGLRSTDYGLSDSKTIVQRNPYSVVRSSSLIAQASTSPRIPTVVEPSPFPDVKTTDPNFNAILELYKRRVVKGYNDGSFHPDSKITRGEFVKIALGVTNCFDCTLPTDSQKTKFTAQPPFPDVNLPAWYYFCIWIAKELKMITGYGDGQFRPERNISRAEAAAVLLRQSGIEIKKAPDQAFLDVKDYAWYRDYVYTAVKIGLIKEHLGFVFPDEEITRGEFAFMGSGLLDLRECTTVDTDGDGAPDAWEQAHNLDALTPNDLTTDNDHDGLPASEEAKLGTDPNNPDSDGDGIPDNVEAHGTQIPGIGLVKTNPNKVDSDGDGIPDNQEINGVDIPGIGHVFTDPTKADTDGDGIPDAVEIQGVDIPGIGHVFTDPTKADTDGDGIPDAVEIGTLDAKGKPQAPLGTDPTKADSDGDGLTDGQEFNGMVIPGLSVFGITGPVKTDPTKADTDGDGVTDGNEIRGVLIAALAAIGITTPVRTNPLKADTDGDGVNDGQEEQGFKPAPPGVPTGGTPPGTGGGGGGTPATPLPEVPGIVYTNPVNPDSDNDGLSDKNDPWPLDSTLPGTGSIPTTGPNAGCPYANNPNQNDTDHDGIIDACDDDIDGDGIKNALGIFDANGVIDPAKVKDSADNCIFKSNSAQTDSDQNKVGNSCEPTDLCPTIPEDLDGVDDQDGCPELTDNTPDETPGVTVNKGPLCGLLDYAADFMPGDILMTAITDQATHTVTLGQSNQVTY